MSNPVYVVFSSRTDEERGLVALMQRAPVDAYARGLYGVDRESTRVLDELGISYRQATQEEILRRAL